MAFLQSLFSSVVQGYLAHAETPTPLGPPKTLGIGLQQGPGRARFLVSEVPL